MHPARFLRIAAILLLASGCGGAASDDEAADAPAEAPADAAPAPAAAGPAPLAVADLDAYEKGMLAEIEAVRQAVARLRAARSGTDTLTAMNDVLPPQTQPAGARAAGMELDRYRDVSSQLDQVLSTRMQTGMADQMAREFATMDTASLPAEQRAQIRDQMKAMQDQAGEAEAAAYAGLPPEVAAALRPRAAHLDSLRLRLVGERLRATQ